MLMELIAAIALGVGVGGIIVLMRGLIGGRVPRFLVPAAAALAMFGFAIWSDYSWFGRTASGLPEDIVVVNTVRERSSWRPWTWAWPQVTRFTAVNAGGARRNEKIPGQVMADVYLIARYAQPVTLPQIVDCPGSLRAELVGDVSLDEDGRPENARWLPLAEDDPLYRALCTDGRARSEG